MEPVSASSVEAPARHAPPFARFEPERSPPAPERSPPAASRWNAFVSFGAALSAIVGILGLAGWIFDVSILKSGFQGLVPIKASTSICLIILSLALWLRTRENQQTPGRILAIQLLAGAVAAIGLVSFGEYLFGWDLGIDQLLFADRPEEAIRSAGLGLIAPVNALSFYFLGLALILLSWTTLREVWPSQMLSFAAGLISVFNLLDFLLVPADLHTYTSLPAAVALAALSLALMCARPQWGYGTPTADSGARHSTAHRWSFQGLAAKLPRSLQYGGTAAAILRNVLDRSLGTTASTYLTFYPATLLAAVLGGLGPGIAATVLSAATAAYFFLDPPGIRVGKLSDVVLLAIFFVTGIGIAALAGSIDRARRRAAEAVRGASLYARSLMEVGFDSQMTISLEGKITDLNHALEDATGVAREALIGTDFIRYFTEPENARAAYRQVFDLGQVTDYPLALRHASGKVTDVLYHARVYRDERGALAGVCAAARDITERKRVERELAVYRQHLEELVTERTAEIQTSNRSLEGANQELETFADSVSHDLRTPLRAMDGFSRILLEDYAPKLDAEGQRIVGVIREGAGKMAQLIDDILAFSRTGRQEIAPGMIDMEDLVRAALKDLEPVLADRNVKVEVKPLPPSYGDGPMIQRLWTNLLDNAIKFTRPKPEGIIEVGAHAERTETIYYVKDNGAGFDMQYVDKLFGVFQRLHGQSEFPGTGIGLAIVKRIVVRHGGRVWAEGKVNAGATVYFALPNGGKS